MQVFFYCSCIPSRNPVCQSIFFPLLLPPLSTDKPMKAQCNLFDSREEIRQPLKSSAKEPRATGHLMEAIPSLWLSLRSQPEEMAGAVAVLGGSRKRGVEMKREVGRAAWAAGWGHSSGSVYVRRRSALQAKQGLELTVSKRLKVHFIGNVV